MSDIVSQKPLVILSGPTAVGKSELSIKLAQIIGGEIISADSMQVYRGMDIGTAKINADEMGNVKHYLIDILDPKEEFNIYSFKEAAQFALEEIISHGKIPIIVGGTGFYIQSLLYDIDFFSTDNLEEYREELYKTAEKRGNDYLHSQLEAVDPVSAGKIHSNDLKRIVRALEYHKQTGMCLSEHNECESHKTSPYNFCYFVLTDEREVIYDKINLRVDKMIEKGLVDEVRRLKENGLDSSYVSMKGLGYKEILDFLDGKITLDEAIYRIKRDSRHFAKRQITWFKRERDVIWLNKNEIPDDKIIDCIVTELKDKKII